MFVLNHLAVAVKVYDDKMVKSPFSCVIPPLTQPQVANQQKKTITAANLELAYNYLSGLNQRE